MSPEQEHADPSGTARRPGAAETVQSADEISLYDLWNVLVRRWFVIAAVFLLIIAAGGLYGTLKEQVYHYSAVIQLGGTFKEDDGPLSPQQALATMRAVYLPDAVDRILVDGPGQFIPDIEAELEEGGRIIVLSGQAGETSGGRYMEVMSAAAEALVDEHLPHITAVRRNLKVSAEQEQGQIRTAEWEAAQLRESLDKLGARETSLSKQLAALEAELAGLRVQRDLLTQGEEPSSASVQPLLALNQSIAEVLGQTTDIKTTAELAITVRRDELIQNIAVTEGTQDKHRSTLARLETELEQLEPSRVAREPRQSMKPTGPGTAVFLALSALLGLMLGVFTAFVVEFLRNARAHADI